MNINKENILYLLKQNEAEKQRLESIKKQATDLKNGSFNRHDFYKTVLFDDMHKDGFVVEYPHGTVVRQSDREWHYRGENFCYPTSQASFIRKLADKTKIEKQIFEFVTNLKLVEFFYILSNLNHYRHFKNLHFNVGNKQMFLSVLFYNIAQHYGFDTNWLDITSDFEIALFFACCKYVDNQWLPLSNDDFNKDKNHRNGRIFRRKSNDFRNMMFPEGRYTVFPVGFQPFMRCHMQYSYAIAMEENMDLNNPESGFECLIFEHSEDLSDYIYRKMDKGKLIYPQEGLSFISDELQSIQCSKSFSIQAFQDIYKNLNFNYSEHELMNLLEKYGYKIEQHPLEIEQSKIDLINKYYENFDVETSYNIKLRTRLTFIP